jgi:GntR family carbon starvation induced transcriptional regulator
MGKKTSRREPTLQSVNCGSAYSAARLARERNFSQPPSPTYRLHLRLSPTPLREALLRLHERGLVEILPNRGARVAGLSAAELDELHELRVLLEPWAVERSVRAGGEGWQAEVQRKLHELRQVRKEAPYAVLDDAHRALHSALMSRCGSQWLLAIVELLADNSSRYRATAGRVLGPRSGAGSARHHQALVDACLSGDADSAAALSKEHVSEMHQVIHESLDGASHIRPVLAQPGEADCLVAQL